MSEFIKKYWFCFSGLLIGIANGLFGSGGGMLAVPMLEKGGIEQKKAHASSIAVTVVLSLVSVIIYFSHDSIDFSTAIKYVPMGIVGAVVGAKLLKKLPDKILRKIFGAVMIIAGVRLLTR